MNTSSSDLDITADLGGQYLKKADFEAGEWKRFVVIAVDRVMFEARNGKPAQTKIVVTFEGEPQRKLALNKTNLRILAKVWGKNAAAWIGRTLFVGIDENVSFGGEQVGGLRVRVPKQAPAKAKPVVAPDDPQPGDISDVGF
jgi:hypothetical protein